MSAVGEWAENGQEGTVGAVLAEQLGCNEDGTLSVLTGGRFERLALLEQAIRLADAVLEARSADGSSAGEEDKAPTDSMADSMGI